MDHYHFNFEIVDTTQEGKQIHLLLGVVVQDEIVKNSLLEANKLIFVRQYKAADKILKTLVSGREDIAPVIIHLRWIELQVKLAKIDEAIEFYENALKVSTKETHKHIFLVALELAKQFGEKVSPIESMAAYQSIMDRFGPSAPCYFGMALSLEAQANINRAVSNYEQSLQLSSEWFPSYFALSQLYYSQGKDSLGDYYFYLFEEKAPYNVYGNFETHKKLFIEFLAKSKFEEAEAAVNTLSTWWLDNKSYCPAELGIFETISFLQSSKAQKNSQRTKDFELQLSLQVDDFVRTPNMKDSVLFFVAKMLDDSGNFDLALKVYARVLEVGAENPQTVQRMGSIFLVDNLLDHAVELFTVAFKQHPDHPEIRFCLLVAELKKSGVPVEEYLLGKERLRKLLTEGGDKVELLSLLHALLSKFNRDSEVFAALADMYLQMSNLEKAKKYFDEALKIDPYSRFMKQKYAAFLLEVGEPKKAMEVVLQIENHPSTKRDSVSELAWLKSNVFFKNKDFTSAKEQIKLALQDDTWNTSYLVHAVAIEMEILAVHQDAKISDDVIQKLQAHNESSLNWKDFDARTRELFEKNLFALAYNRQKIKFLYTPHNEESLARLLEYAKAHDAEKAIFDLMKLLNTNFDSPLLVLSIATLYKEIWQLESARNWFQYAQTYPLLSSRHKAFSFLEIADCLLWEDRDSAKALEFANLSLDLGQELKPYVIATMVHAHLKNGKLASAKSYLEHEIALQSKDAEIIFFRGLFEYRNGAKATAKKIWKPLLTIRTETLKLHHIKQELMKYYFDSKPYLRVESH